MVKRSTLKDRLLGLFKSSAPCNLAPKSLPDSVREPVVVSSGRRHHDAATAYLPRSRSLPPSSDQRPSESGLLIHSNGGGRMDGNLCPTRSPASQLNRRFMHQENNNTGSRRKKKKKKKMKKLLMSNPYGFTTSSTEEEQEEEDDDDDELFGNDERVGETETLFSSDSSEFYYNSCRSRRKMMPSRRRALRRSGGIRIDGCANDGIRPLVSVSSRMESGDGKKKEKDKILEEKEEDGDDGVAVVKDSDNPHADFTISMLEMIMEKQICGKEELEALLHCYLSLNSPRHHPIILKVFSVICEVVFCI